MGEIVNLRRARKAKARAVAAAGAAERRLAFGRTRGERIGDAAERGRVDRVLDGAALPSRAAPIELLPPSPAFSSEQEGA